MSWIVESILLNRDIIRSSLYNKKELAREIVLDFDSDVYNDLLTIESKIDELHKKGLLSDFELEVIDYMTTNLPMTILQNKMNVSRFTISKIFKSACDKISYYLGGSYTDEGFIEYFSKKHSLTDKQIHRLKVILSGRLDNRKY